MRLQYTYDFKKIQKARIEKRMSQAEVAALAGLSADTVSKLERGLAPWLKAIEAVEQVLGITVNVRAKSERRAS